MSQPELSSQPDKDIRPVIRTGASSRVPLLVFGILLLLGGAWIVSLMSEQREAMERSGLEAEPNPSELISSPPPLDLARDYGYDPLGPRPTPTQVVVRTVPARTQVATAVRRVSSPAPQQPVDSPPLPQPVAEPIPAVTFASPQPPAIATAEDLSSDEVSRIRAARLANPSLTVPQGTVIPAVLETALDSTRPGGVRALVQRDVHSFDGTRILIHRGSRLYGEYDAQLQRGQNRALIRWTRLIRPDGVTVALDSPASDPLGRAGVRGKVDGKFLQRFGGAVLQSVLDIGVGVATRQAGDGVIVALPGSTQNVAPRVSQADIPPTLKVRHGTSVSVFVANDLDFSSVDS